MPALGTEIGRGGVGLRSAYLRKWSRLMRILSLLLCAVALTHASPVRKQDVPQGPPGVVILKYDWNAHVDRPDWDRDLYRNPIEAADDEREKTERARSRPPNEREPRLGPGELPPAPKYRRKQTRDGTGGFQYRVTVKNTGGKTIRSVGWDYVFIDPPGGREVARHSFESRGRIKPGRSKELIHFSVSAPTKVVGADTVSSGDVRRPFVERLIIKRIEYADGSVWARP
jgi:hypothetical protein